MQQKILHFIVVLALLTSPVKLQSSPASFLLRIHPDAPLKVGDQLSFEVFSSQGADLNGKEIEIELADNPPQWLGKAQFQPQEDGSYQAVLYWVWNTTGFAPRTYTLHFKILPEGESWEEIVTLQPAASNQGPSPQWTTVQLSCCQVNYITQTRVERDLPKLIPIIEAAAESAEDQMDIPIHARLPVNLIPRQLGQGGFTSREIYVSYPDVDYTGIDLNNLLHHEIVHYLDRQRYDHLPPLLLAEGLAVYLSDGHYKSEPILLKAAALVQQGRFVPYPYLADNFSQVQHETAYIEAGAFVDYLVHTYGRPSFEKFYQTAREENLPKASNGIDAALQKTLNISLEDINRRLTDYLSQLPATPDVIEDLDLEIRYFDFIRAYQAQFEPSADYRQVWLPDGSAMRQRGITADYFRRTISLEGQLIEKSLSSVGDAWVQGLYPLARRKISEVEWRLNKGK